MTYPQIEPFPVVNAVVTGSDLVATLSGFIYPRRLTGLNIVGPTGSRCDVYLHTRSEQNRIDSTLRGERNTAAFTTPHLIQPGTQIHVVWPNQSGTASCTFFMEAVR